MITKVRLYSGIWEPQPKPSPLMRGHPGLYHPTVSRLATQC